MQQTLRSAIFMRCFIAVDIPPAVRDAVSAIQTQLRAGLDNVVGQATWVKPEQMHFTLWFFAEVPAADVPRLQEGIAEAARQVAPFTATLGALGLFPESGAPRVLWVGLSEGGGELTTLFQALVASLKPRGWEPEARAFHPHLTLARFKSPVSRQAVQGVLEQQTAPSASFHVEGLSLIQSVLSPHGPRYTTLYTAPLHTAS